MFRQFRNVVGIVSVIPFAVAAAAKPADRPELFAKLVECRAIADAAARLACYDSQVGALDAAEAKKDLIVMDRQQVKETRRSLFGFTLPKFSLGGEREDGADDITEIETELVSARAITNDRWQITLANGAGTWETASALTRGEPEAGDKVRIKNAALGSYLGSIGYNRGVRFRRVY